MHFTAKSQAYFILSKQKALRPLTKSLREHTQVQNNGRFQFDSASGSNNSIVVEGLDVTNLL